MAPTIPPLQPQVGLRQQVEVPGELLEPWGSILKENLQNKSCKTPSTLVNGYHYSPLQPQVGLRQQVKVPGELLEPWGCILKGSLLNKNCRAPSTLVNRSVYPPNSTPGWSPATGRSAQRASGDMGVHLEGKFTKQKL
jgi:hypothetical protein